MSDTRTSIEAVKTDRSLLEDGTANLPFVCGCLLRFGVFTSSIIGLRREISGVARQVEERDLLRLLCLCEDPIKVIVEEIKAVFLNFGIEPSPAVIAGHPCANGMNPLVWGAIPLRFGHRRRTES